MCPMYMYNYNAPPGSARLYITFEACACVEMKAQVMIMQASDGPAQEIKLQFPGAL